MAAPAVSRLLDHGLPVDADSRGGDRVRAVVDDRRVYVAGNRVAAFEWRR